ncbi:hypothetical protein DM02DRAFT_655060 [Periconia macrospinosa]|uniref:F-box domain-containing protein n=1 Tax=Periconia macrospinosa TaxID=97972 RepID=A0A2V1DU89_9PLEO|nr:hypothetical protein DM02DRAFT_655060 [Periconia macrospinosa]
MPSPIESLPHELFRYVVTNLEIQDVARFMRVSKPYHALLEPILWNQIELHGERFHVKQTQKVLQKEENIERQKPLYALAPPESEDDPWQYTQTYPKAMKLLRILSTHQEFGYGLSEVRTHDLASMVTWLCLSLKPEYNPTIITDSWNALTQFVNLEYLELSVFWIRNEYQVPFRAPEHALSGLRTVKLRGYLHKEFTQWLLKKPAGIEELHLGILDFPVAGNTDPDWAESIPPEMRRPEDFDELSNEERGKWESIEDLCHGSVAARALACLTPSIMEKFEKLKKIYLYKPGSPQLDNELHDLWDLLYFSVISDSQILEEWKNLIRATRATLEYIILDQRPVAHENAPDGTGNKDYMWVCACGPSYHRFVETVLPTLLESEEFTALKTIRLFGFEPDVKGPSDYVRDWTSQSITSVNMPPQLQAAFPHVEVTDHVGRRMVMNDQTGEPESVEDEVYQCYNGFESDTD